MNYRIIRVRDHYEVYDSQGRFRFSADSYSEANREILELEAA